MKLRVISSVAGILIIVMAYLIPDPFFIVLAMLLCLLMAHEYINALQNASIRPMGFFLYAWTIIYYIVIYLYYHSSAMDMVLFTRANVLLFIIFTAACLFTAVFNRKYELKDSLFTLFGFIYVVFLASFIVFVRYMDMGGWLLGYILLGAFGTDVFSFLIGSRFGKTKILPRISPNKTLAGFFGGYFGCMVLLALYSLIAVSFFTFSLPMGKLVLVCLTFGIVSQAGDWLASYIKRQMRIKDFGTIMPGHGGGLDRLDSIILLAPLAYYIFIL
ncbi:MAG: phosphatidate cytidylyltransferase [Clostridia bacterium]